MHLAFLWTFYIVVRWFSLSPAHKRPGICHLTVEMFRGLVQWMLGWLTLHGLSCVACLRVPKNVSQTRLIVTKKKTVSLTDPTNKHNFKIKFGLGLQFFCPFSGEMFSLGMKKVKVLMLSKRKNMKYYNNTLYQFPVHCYLHLK